MGKTYPVHENCITMDYEDHLHGKECKEGYDSHYVLVSERQRYQPISKIDEEITGDELVAFSQYQVLPRYIIYYSTSPSINIDTSKSVVLWLDHHHHQILQSSIIKPPSNNNNDNEDEDELCTFEEAIRKGEDSIQVIYFSQLSHLTAVLKKYESSLMKIIDPLFPQLISDVFKIPIQSRISIVLSSALLGCSKDKLLNLSEEYLTNLGLSARSRDKVLNALQQQPTIDLIEQYYDQQQQSNNKVKQLKIVFSCYEREDNKTEEYIKYVGWLKEESNYCNISNKIQTCFFFDKTPNYLNFSNDNNNNNDDENSIIQNIFQYLHELQDFILQF